MDFYETLHSCSTLPADVHEGMEYGCCPKFKRGDNSTILSRKWGACTL